ncbi:MAG: hypothetical protein Q7S57_04120 [bacterium]|nr:hypothetical protein [bacterium]
MPMKVASTTSGQATKKRQRRGLSQSEACRLKCELELAERRIVSLDGQIASLMQLNQELDRGKTEAEARECILRKHAIQLRDKVVEQQEQIRGMEQSCRRVVLLSNLSANYALELEKRIDALEESAKRQPQDSQ